MMYELAESEPLTKTMRPEDDYRVEVWTSGSGERFAELGPLLKSRGERLDPRVFLASLSQGWIARMMVVRRGCGIAGVVYLQEKAIAGIPLRLLDGDDTLGNLVLAENADRHAVLRVAFEELFASGRARGLRLLLAPDGGEAEVVSGVADSLNLRLCRHRRFVKHTRLFLPGGYEEFLESLSYRARRNFRYYRKRFESAGSEYVASLSMEELRASALHLRTACNRVRPVRAVERILNWVGAVKEPLACGLRNKEGEWVSVAAGFYDSGRVTMLLQLNDDSRFGHNSLGNVLRGYLIEELIGCGYKELIFRAGTGGILGRYASPMPGIGFYLDTPGFGWATVRSLVRVVGPRLSKNVRKELQWITPFGPAAGTSSESDGFEREYT